MLGYKSVQLVYEMTTFEANNQGMLGPLFMGGSAPPKIRNGVWGAEPPLGGRKISRKGYGVAQDPIKVFHGGVLWGAHPP